MKDDALAAALASDLESARIGAADRAMLRYAEKLTCTPPRISASDVDELKAVGFSESAILDICQVASYFNYVNRLADGLGVELEGFWSGEDLTMTREEFDEIVTSREQGGTTQ